MKQNKMKRIGLTPNKSYDIFILGDNIVNYLHLPHHMKSYDDQEIYHDTYYFDNFNFEVWVENGRIETICCDIECYWQDKNLIKMFYKEFLTLINYQQSDSNDFVYVPISRDRGQNQRVHYFDKLGLTLWVWREKIRTILIYDYKDE